jgi:hypothetical protein
LTSDESSSDQTVSQVDEDEREQDLSPLLKNKNKK